MASQAAQSQQGPRRDEHRAGARDPESSARSRGVLPGRTRQESRQRIRSTGGSSINANALSGVNVTDLLVDCPQPARESSCERAKMGLIRQDDCGETETGVAA